MKIFHVGMNPRDSALFPIGSSSSSPSVNTFALLVWFSTPLPNSERQVIIDTVAKCLVKSLGKTELTCVELNLEILDGILLPSLTTCQVAFPALPLLAGPVCGPERCFALPLPSFLPPEYRTSF